MSIVSIIKKLAISAAIAVGAVSAAQAAPGCVGKMWNPLVDLDYRLMGGIKVAGFKLMPSPSQLGDPPEHKPEAICTCKDGLNSGVGIGMTFWMPSYINDMARQAGCIGFLGGINILPGFISESSGQEYNHHTPNKDGVTNMQIHWAYADVTALAGKSLFERCHAVTGAMSIAYMTEPDFIFQNDVYSVVMTPQAAILAAAPLLSQITCGMESVANTLGGWQDFGVCAWKGARMPLSGNTIAKDSAQVTNMDITVKYLTRAALLGTTLRTMGKDATCRPVYSPFYDPFQHRYQWSYPNKVSTRYNVDVIRWGLFVKDQGSVSMMDSGNNTIAFEKVDTTKAAGTAGSLGLAEQIVAKLPKPLNYPTREAGYMQVWEARQCCIMVLTIENIIKAVITSLVDGGSAQLKELYDLYNTIDLVYKVIQDPIGAALGFIGDGIASVMGDVAGGIGDSIGNLIGPGTI